MSTQYKVTVPTIFPVGVLLRNLNTCHIILHSHSVESRNIRPHTYIQTHVRPRSSKAAELWLPESCRTLQPFRGHSHTSVRN